MPTAVIETPAGVAAAGPRRKVWTRTECEKLETLGFLEGQHFELIQGDLVNKMGKKRPHSNGLTSLVVWLAEVFGSMFVQQEVTIDVAPEDNPTSEPEPDAVVLRRKYSDIRSGNPKPEDLHLVVEVSDTTLPFDLVTKAALYARAGIVEYWVLDVNGRRLLVHRVPQGGRYSSVVAYGENESVAPLAAPQSEFRVRDAFPD